MSPESLGVHPTYWVRNPQLYLHFWHYMGYIWMISHGGLCGISPIFATQSRDVVGCFLFLERQSKNILDKNIFHNIGVCCYNRNLGTSLADAQTTASRCHKLLVESHFSAAPNSRIGHTKSPTVVWPVAAINGIKYLL